MDSDPVSMDKIEKSVSEQSLHIIPTQAARHLCPCNEKQIYHNFLHDD